MSDEHPNATLVRRMVDRLTAGDLDGALACYADDAVYRVGGNNLVSGNYRGHQAISDFFVALGEVTGVTMRMFVDDVIGADGHAVLFWHGTAERPPKTLDAHGIMAFKVDGEGKFSESWFLYNDQQAYDDFFS